MGSGPGQPPPRASASFENGGIADFNQMELAIIKRLFESLNVVGRFAKHARKGVGHGKPRRMFFVTEVSVRRRLRCRIEAGERYICPLRLAFIVHEKRTAADPTRNAYGTWR